MVDSPGREVFALDSREPGEVDQGNDLGPYIETQQRHPRYVKHFLGCSSVRIVIGLSASPKSFVPGVNPRFHPPDWATR